MRMSCITKIPAVSKRTCWDKLYLPISGTEPFKKIFKLLHRSDSHNSFNHTANSPATFHLVPSLLLLCDNLHHSLLVRKAFCWGRDSFFAKTMKLTQVKFAEIFGVSARKVSEWEHGKSVPDKHILEKMRKLKK